MAVSRYFIDIEDRVPAATVVAYQRGAIVNGSQDAVNAVTVFSGHEFQASDKFYYAKDRTNVQTARVFTVSSVTSTTVTFSGAKFSFPDKALLVPLGADTGATVQSDGSFSAPEWDGSRETIYEDPAGSSSLTNSIADVEAGGEVGFWGSGNPLWLVARNNAKRPVRIYMDVGGIGGGATSSEYYNIEDYGASTSGTTNSVAINAAISAASSAGGGIVWVPTGTFTVEALIDIKSNVTIDGVGTLQMIADFPTSSGMIRDDGAVSNIRIRNIVLDGNGSNQSVTSNRHLIFLNDASSNIRIEGITVVDAAATSDGIGVSGSTDVVISNCRLKDNGRTGVLFTGSSSVTIRDNYIEGGTVGIQCESPSSDMDDILVSGNVITGQSSSGIELGGNNTGPKYVRNASIVGNTISDTESNAGIVAFFCRGLIIGNNNLSGCTDSGIWVANSSKWVIIDGNSIRDGVRVNTISSDIELRNSSSREPSDHVIISNNLMVNGGGEQALIVDTAGGSNTCTDVLIQNNIIDDSADTYVNYLARIQNCQRVTIAGNLWKNGDSGGGGKKYIQFNEGSYTTSDIKVIDNTFVEVDDSGASPLHCTGTAINNWTITGNTFPDGNHVNDTSKLAGDIEYHGNTGGTAVAIGGFTQDIARRGANEQRAVLSQATTTLADLSSSATATNLIPAGSLVIGVTCRVTTLITADSGGVSFDIGTGSDADAFGTGIAFAADTTTDLTDTTETSPLYYSSATSIVLAPDAGSFTAGAVRLTVHYLSLTAETS